MKLVIQRVEKASVSVFEKKEIVGEIAKGLFVLVGVGDGDTVNDADTLAEKLVKLRIMGDNSGKMNLSIKDINGEILVVSQFTLFTDTNNGNRPSFVSAAKPELAKNVYEHFVARLKETGLKIQTGKFGAYMEINLTLDGPVTILI